MKRGSTRGAGQAATPRTWEAHEIRVVRWFMRFAGVGLILPGVIYVLSWPDTTRAFELAVGSALAWLAAAATVAGSLVGGATFLLARYAKPGAILAAGALALGAFVHLQWMRMMQNRLSALPETLTEAQSAEIRDAILFAANAQAPHMLKNLILVGVCVMVFLLAPRLCGDHVEDEALRH